MIERKSREQAEFEAFLRAKRAYEKKRDDIRYMYEEFYPLLDDYKAGRLSIDMRQNLFQLEASSDDVSAEG